METNKKFIFLDIDGTIYQEFGVIPESAREAIRGAKENGHHIFVSSGRGKYEIPEEIMELGIEGMVASAGAYVEINGEILADSYLEKKLTDKVIDFMEENEIIYIVSSGGRLYGTSRCIKNQIRYLEEIAGESKMAEQSAKKFKTAMKIVEDTKKVQGICKILFFNSEQVTVEDIRNRFGRELTVIHGSIDFMTGESGEIYGKNVSKATGMKKIINYYGIKREDTIAFGDGENDFEMIAYAGTGVAMGNGVKALKEQADYVTDTAADNGLYKGFAYLGLI